MFFFLVDFFHALNIFLIFLFPEIVDKKNTIFMTWCSSFLSFLKQYFGSIIDVSFIIFSPFPHFLHSVPCSCIPGLIYSQTKKTISCIHLKRKTVAQTKFSNGNYLFNFLYRCRDYIDEWLNFLTAITCSISYIDAGIWKREGWELYRFVTAFYRIFCWKRPPLMFYPSYQNGGKIQSIFKPPVRRR